MTPLEIIAAIFIAGVLIKMAIIVIRPSRLYHGTPVRWLEKSSFAYSYTIGIAAIVFFYLYQQLTLLELFVGVLLGSFMVFIMLVPYIPVLLRAVRADIDNGINIYQKLWLGTLLWLVLMGWVIWETFI